MGMILDDRIGYIVAPGLGLGHDWHLWFVVGNACDATAGALGQWASSALSFSSLFLSLCKVDMVFDAIHLRNWLKLNWTHDCTFLCGAEDEWSNSQFVCILSGNVVQRISRLLWFSKDIHVKISSPSHSASTMDLNLFSAYQFC